MASRVWNDDTVRSREAQFVRFGVMDGMKWAGTLMLCRQAYIQQDIELGRVTHCPDCWDAVLKQVRTSRCPSCYGTGYAGGYKPVFTVWASISENSPVDEKYEKQGMRTEQNTTIKLPVDHIFHDGDLFAEVRRSIDGRPLELGRVFKLDGAVQQQTVQGWVSNNTNDRETVMENMIVSQSGPCKLLLPTDLIYQSDKAFWGLDTAPYIEDGHICEPPNASKDEYAREVDERHIKLNWWS